MAIKIITIGQILYYESQELFVNRLADHDGIELSFVGLGPASKPLEYYVVKHDINADSCMANRFYLSAQLRKPMIVSKGSYQGELFERYCLGVALDENDDFSEKIKEWWRAFDYEKYNSGCRAFLEQVEKDMLVFKDYLMDLYHKTA